MFKRYLFFLLIISTTSLLSQGAYKAMKDTVGFKSNVDKMSKETNSIQSDFTQVKNLSILSEKITSKGAFWFMKQNNLRWEYSDPYKYVIVINKDKILIKDESNKVKKYDMNSNKVFKEINDIMISCVNGDILKSNKFSIHYFENDKGYRLELIPLIKSMKESLKKINMYFDKNVTSVIKLEMFENGDDTTTIDFTNKKINETISSDKFTLK
ncbi:LolA family protein [Aurantibacillus circumpalustris]|uniref:LolA family protein n=1 Tax=Aurantibacillus circumpalustris TaxID=3036359 RepID=UPI00295B7995|nr:outer membrane lipoprotein carrier protein LolA [Aurantibacillus circumpalustris]